MSLFNLQSLDLPLVKEMFFPLTYILDSKMMPVEKVHRRLDFGGKGREKWQENYDVRCMLISETLKWGKL